MNQPTTPAGTPRPPRAEPLQPDRPGRGGERAEDTTGAPSPDPAEQQRRQSEDALDNVREGYDR